MQPRVEEEAALKTGCRCRRNDRGVVGLLCSSLRPFNLLCSLRLFISPPPCDFINNTFWVLPTTSALSLSVSLSLCVSLCVSLSLSLSLSLPLSLCLSLSSQSAAICDVGPTVLALTLISPDSLFAACVNHYRFCKVVFINN